MSIFISSQEYLTLENECKQVSYIICGHHYKLWCKKDKIDQVNIIIEKISPIIEKIYQKNKILSFDKILLMAMIDILSKDKEFKQETKEENNNLINENNFEEKNLINDFIDILQTINKSL